MRRGVVPACALAAVLAASCSGRLAPPPVASPIVSGQSEAYVSGTAHVVVSGGLQGSFDLSLAPSAIYPSPPPVVVLSYGRPGSGAGLTVQAAARTGSAPTSDREIVSLTVPSSGSPLELDS